MLDRFLVPPYSVSEKKWTQANPEDCLPMGDGCFHPQFGMIPVEEFEGRKKKTDESPYDDAVEGATDVKTINAVDTELINCEKENYFDVFCGKSRKSKSNPMIEIWVDTSTSMKNADYSKDQRYCERRHFVSNMRKTCEGKILFSTFDSTVMELGSDQNLCNYVGINNGERLVDAIKGSNAKYLLIVTDVDEYKDEFREYLDLVGAKLTGIDATKVTSDKLTEIYKSQFQKLCR